MASGADGLRYVVFLTESPGAKKKKKSRVNSDYPYKVTCITASSLTFEIILR